MPGGLWLILFFVVPMIVMASVSLQEGLARHRLPMTWNFGVFPEVISQYSDTQFFARSGTR